MGREEMSAPQRGVEAPGTLTETFGGAFPVTCVSVRVLQRSRSTEHIPVGV